jgi:hypothetical protein
MPKRSQGANPKTITPPKKSTIDEGRGEITYRISFTKNLGDFESMRLEAGVTLPVNFTDEMLDDAMEKAEVMRDKVAQRIFEDLDSLNSKV